MTCFILACQGLSHQEAAARYGEMYVAWRLAPHTVQFPDGEALEGAIAADLLPKEARGTGYGVLATVNGLGDFLSSLVVGALWAGVSPTAGFSYAAALSLAGAIIIYRLR